MEYNHTIMRQQVKDTFEDTYEVMIDLFEDTHLLS